jgi:hypothetical protein
MHEAFMIVENKAIITNRGKMKPSQIALNMAAQLSFLQRESGTMSYL